MRSHRPGDIATLINIHQSEDCLQIQVRDLLHLERPLVYLLVTIVSILMSCICILKGRKNDSAIHNYNIIVTSPQNST